MFISSSTKGAVAYNVLIMMAIVVISVVIAISFLTFKPKGTTGSLKASLDLGNKSKKAGEPPISAGTGTKPAGS